MARNLISWPQVVFPAFNPATVYAEATNGEEDIEMYFIIDGVAATRHKREFFAFAQPLTDNFGEPITDNGGQLLPVGGTPTARFDLGQVAKWYFSNAVEEINAADNIGTWKTKAYMERRLSFPFRAEFMKISEGEVTAGIDFVAVNAALPAGVPEAKQMENIESQTPGHKLTVPTDVANATYLLGCEDNTAISGQSIFVDYGFSIARVI